MSQEIQKDSPVVIYTNLFTLAGKDIKFNKYIDMYYVWLFNIIKYGKLRENDYVITLIDEVTYNHIKKLNVFLLLTSKIANCIVILYKQPQNIKEGMLQRYNINNILDITSVVSSFNPYYSYLDVDVLVVQDIRKLFENSNIDNGKTTIYIKREEDILGTNYYGDLITDEERDILKDKKMLNMPGFSSGIYAWRNSKDIKEYFEFILNMSINTSKTLYTIDQPFFNGAIFNYLFKKIGVYNFVIIKDNKVAHNKFICDALEETVLLNFCGIPGDDSFHWDKILTELFMSSL